jgi:hypothetical protein
MRSWFLRLFVGAITTLCIAGAGGAQAETTGPATELSPDRRPVLLLQLPSAGRTPESDRGFGAALLLQLSHVAANWPWRTLIVSTSGPESDSQLQTLPGEDAVVAVVKDDLVDVAGKLQFHVSMALVTVRAIATRHEARVQTPVEYFAPVAVAGRLDDQVSTAATDLSQFLAAIVARASVPKRLRAHNPTLGELGAHPVCGRCVASDPVVYQQPGRVWVRVGKRGGSILALPLQSARAAARNKDVGSQAIP